MIWYGRLNFLKICDLQQYCVETSDWLADFLQSFWFSQNLASIHNMSFSQNTSESCSQIRVKVVHTYRWKLFTNTIESLHESIFTHWPLKLKLDPEAGFCSYNWRGMSRHCLILIPNIFLQVINTFVPDIYHSALLSIYWQKVHWISSLVSDRAESHTRNVEVE